MIPALHERFLASAVAVLSADARIAGVAAGGSFVSGDMDDFSDLDLVVVVFGPEYERVLAERHELAAKLGRCSPPSPASTSGSRACSFASTKPASRFTSI